MGVVFFSVSGMFPKISVAIILSSITLSAGLIKHQYDRSFVCSADKHKEAIEQLGEVAYKYEELVPLLYQPEDVMQRDALTELVVLHSKVETTTSHRPCRSRWRI